MYILQYIAMLHCNASSFSSPCKSDLITPFMNLDQSAQVLDVHTRFCMEPLPSLSLTCWISINGLPAVSRIQRCVVLSEHKPPCQKW